MNDWQKRLAESGGLLFSTLAIAAFVAKFAPRRPFAEYAAEAWATFADDEVWFTGMGPLQTTWTRDGAVCLDGGER